MRILLVEDSEQKANAIKATLSEAGHGVGEIVHSVDITNALRMAEQEALSGIILDMTFSSSAVAETIYLVSR